MGKPQHILSKVFNNDNSSGVALKNKILKGLIFKFLDQTESASINEISKEINQHVVNSYLKSNIEHSDYALEAEKLDNEMTRIYGIKINSYQIIEEQNFNHKAVEEAINQQTAKIFKDKVELYGESSFKQATTEIFLSTLDFEWKDHLLSLDKLRNSINLRAYAQKDPLLEYKKEAFDLFEEMLARIEEQTISYLSHLKISMQSDRNNDLDDIINNNQITNYIITYAAMDSFGNIAIKTRNLIISYPKSNSYETTNGNLQLTNLNFNALNNTDWTCEAWILITYNNGPVAIFDFRQPNNGNAYLPPNHFWLEINNFKPVIQAMSNRNLIGSSITTTIPLNKWTHVVWMRKNNIFYTFINGLPSPGETVPSYLNSLSGLQYMVHGVYANLIYNNSTSGHLNGQINQPLITLGAKYNTSGFTVRWILYPPDLTNVLYHLIEDIDLISNQNIIKNRSIIINIITSDPLVPIMKLIGGNTVNLLLGNPYTDLGVTITDYFGTTITSYNLIGSVDSNTLGLYLLTYSATDNRSSTINQIRYVYVNNSTVYSSLFFWIDPSDLNTINYNNTSIVSITDKSGTNIVLTQYTSTSIPQLKLNGINGLPVLDLTNSSSLKSINTYANSYNVTLAVVVTFFQTTNWGVIWGHFNNHDSDITLRNTAGSVYINWHTNNDNSNVQIPYIANTPVLYLATLTNGTSRWLQVINLITGNTNTISGTNSLTMTLANCPFYLGSSEVTSELALCYIGECMYWKRVLNGSELLQVKSYLYNKWSLNNIKNFNIYSPVISLIGNATVYIYNGSVFNDLGAIASDYQGNTLEYSTSGYVNISINDTYIVTYTVSTIYGTTSIQRNVIVY